MYVSEEIDIQRRTITIPEVPPDGLKLLRELLTSSDEELVSKVLDLDAVDDHGAYLHWQDMRYRMPPDGLTAEQWWVGTDFARGKLRREQPLRDSHGAPFGLCMIDRIWELLHRIDQAAAGQILADDPVASPGSGDRYIVRSLIEEAIASSQLEGASTTRAVAKKMLLDGRDPRDLDERMIFNNYAAINDVRRLVRDETPFSVAALQRLHRVITDNTLDDPRDAGRFQEPHEQRVTVVFRHMGRERTLHEPPPAEQLLERMEALCAFANGEAGSGFMHPVVRAVIVHFWLAHDHPFVDGNGRLARSLFYWSMLRSKYWLTEYLAISAILRDDPIGYPEAFLRTETDNNDLTYFIIYKLQVIEDSIKRLEQYLQRKRKEVREVEAHLRGQISLNHRQRNVLSTAIRDPFAAFYIATHARRHQVSYLSARTDLIHLEDLGLLNRTRDGRSIRFAAALDLVDRLRSLNAPEVGDEPPV